MSVLYLVLPLAMLIAAGMVWAFVRSVRKGQFDDLETPAMRILFDDPPQRRPPAATPDPDPASASAHAHPIPPEPPAPSNH
jgi:cbb3-type cytochrome oxidase maturation protein